MKLSFLFVVFVLAISSGTSAFADERDYGRLQTEKLAEGVWLMRQPDRLWANVIGNVTIVEQSDGVVLFDAGGSYADGSQVADEVERLTAKPVKAIIISHWHNDHSLGAGAIRDRWPKVRVIATAATRAALSDVFASIPTGKPQLRTATYLNRLLAFAYQQDDLARDQSLSVEVRSGYAEEAKFLRAISFDRFGPTLALPTELVERDLHIADAERPIEVRYHGNANTEGDLTMWLPRQRILVSGDIVVAPTPYGFGSFPLSWIAVLEELSSYDFNVLVPGHGKPQRDTAYLELLADALATVRKQVTPLAEEGLSAEQILERVEYNELIERFAGEDGWKQLWLQRYWLTPITESAWREATGEQTVQRMVN